MGKQPKSEIKDMVVADVRITDVSALPAKYFLHDEVIAALKAVVRSDVVVHGNPVPPGAKPVMVPSSSATALGAGMARLAGAAKDIELRQKTRHAVAQVLYIVLGAILAVALLLFFYYVWRPVNG